MNDKNKRNPSASIHPDLLAAQKYAYEPSGLLFNKLEKEAESEEYGAYILEMKDRRIKFRTGKITPTKTGQFVTLWKRIGNGPILPHDLEDPIDLFVVSVRKDEKLGQFVFPKVVLSEKGIVSKQGVGGKRAIRVYPPWDKVESPQAKKTQAWQLMYFFEIHPSKCINTVSVQKLFLFKI